ncbi:T9SS-dependent choice-of-anchor J family protein [Kaistella antarctica]|uniref:Por secretion system C-terminal sorting domain n=1 Tax=Kaistella antarctica TaxID=266748 RepID=A0A448NR52_9FLAO|nr:choice-of-anchor J domain-containing protein [Kaistella antarctica]KEY18904.1 hypothetical protein HY04_10610 [Kaistella antarctica]SEW14035.1 Por secretion system C-terminal sorting domain-containing protein [Kaistella antarctica]VEH99249.1 Por secretion system C-terminal sorting domain [Kaistella antarctica]
MKNSLLFGISLFFGSFLIAQNTTVNSASAKPTAAVNLPYSYGFETADLDEWLVTNEGSGNVWERTTASPSTPDPSEGTYYMLYQYHPTDAANSYLYSRGLNLQAGKNITLEFDYQGIDPFFAEKMEVRIGTAATVAGQTTQLWINEDIGNYPYDTASINFTVPADGVYYIAFRVFSDADVFYLALDNIKVFDGVLATQNVSKSSLKFYPNPVKEILTISDAQEISAITIFDITGKQVISETAKSAKLEMNVSQLKPGVYVVKAMSAGVLKTFKFIKK